MDLIDALELQPHDCLAIAGGGGKTTIMYRLAREAVARGWRAVVGGTTRFTPPAHGSLPPIALVEPGTAPVARVSAALQQSSAVTASAGRGDRGRLLPISSEQADELATAGVALLVLEADGSRNRPFKAPGEGEPVVPGSATVLLIVVGLDVLGRPLDEQHVHRPERVAALTGATLGESVAVDIVARVLLHPDGGRKGLPLGARWLPVLNKAEPARLQQGLLLAQRLVAGGADRVLLCTAAAAAPVVQVMGR